MSAQDAVAFMRHVQEAESTNRQEAQEDLKFRFGDQWPASMTELRGARPKLVVNETDAYIRQITNQLREQRPRIKVYAANTVAQKKLADIISGIFRHIQVKSHADSAYDLASEFAVTCGTGYWRVNYDYVREDSFDMDLSVEPVYNPFTVYRDPASNSPDGSDMEKCLVTDKMLKSDFRREFPGRQDSGFTPTSTGDNVVDWEDKDSIRLAEYFTVEKVKARLVLLSNGMTVWEGDPILTQSAALRAANIHISGNRASYKRKVMWEKVTAAETLQSKEWAGRWIPIVPVFGSVMVVESKKIITGAVRFARDPQRMVNYWQTAITEVMAMAPKAKFLMAEGQDEGHENEWNKANTDATATLRYKMTDIEGREAPPPIRIAPEPPPEGLVLATQMASQNLKRVMGMFDPETNVQGPKSGRAINAERQQTELSNYHFYDNFTRSLDHTGSIFLDLMKPVYRTPNRVVAIIGDDGKTGQATLNEQKALSNEILNDVRVGEYGIIMDTGPGYNSKRQEAAEVVGNVLAQDEKLMALIGDLWFRNLDFPGSEVIADRLAAANPLAQIDDKSDVPPQAQMMIKNLQQHLQQATQALQQAGMTIKYRTDIEGVKQAHEDHRELLRQTTKAHDTEVSGATKRHDTETRALTAQHVEELKGLVQLLLSHHDIGKFIRETALKDRELDIKENQAERAETPS